MFCFILVVYFIFLFEKNKKIKKLCTVNLHDVPVPRGTPVPSLGMARCVPYKHGRQKSSSDLARVAHAEWHDHASCAEKVIQ